MTVLGRNVLGAPVCCRCYRLQELERRRAASEELPHQKRPPLGCYVAPEGLR